MKKGFTLMELLIVMVIVTIFVTIALPKYKAAMERGRGMEAIANAQAVSDAINTYYIVHENSNGNKSSLCQYALGSNNCQTLDNGAAALARNTFFDLPDISVEGDKITVSVARNGLSEDKTYTIFFVSQNGEVIERYCTGYQAYCNILGAGKTRSGGGWNF